MYLTKKGLVKIILLAVCYFILGSGCITGAIVFANMGIEADLLFKLGIIVYALDILVILWGRYAEGKGKLINLGNKLVRNELKPAEFLKMYHTLKHANDLVINKPSLEVLQLVTVAYDALNDRENCLATADEMVAVASEKKKAYATLLKASVLFSYDKVEEAEDLFISAQKRKLDITATALVDTILKSDRAIAMEDYATAQTYNLKLLERRFPKLDNLGKLVIHHTLGELYEKLNDYPNAVLHYQYCATYGGETALRLSAAQKLQQLC